MISMKKFLYAKMAKVCMTPEDYTFKYVTGSAGMGEAISRIREYVKCINKVEREWNDKL